MEIQKGAERKKDKRKQKGGGIERWREIERGAERMRGWREKDREMEGDRERGRENQRVEGEG